MKTLKKVIALLLVSCLLMCVAPTAFAAESGVATIAETSEEEDIRDNPIAQGAFKEIIESFVNSFIEVITRYIQVIMDFIQNMETPESPELPDVNNPAGEIVDPAA